MRAVANFQCALVQYQNGSSDRAAIKKLLPSYLKERNSQEAQWNVYAVLPAEDRPIDWNCWKLTFIALNCFDHNLSLVRYVRFLSLPRSPT